MSGNFIKLDDGRRLYNDYGKYRPNLTYVLTEIPMRTNRPRNLPDCQDISCLPWTDCHARDFNFDGRVMRKLSGDFWISQKGTACFAPKADGRHILLREDWGNKRDRGDMQKMIGMVYFRRASSNGGGVGTTYAVVPKDWCVSINIEDI